MDYNEFDIGDYIEAKRHNPHGDKNLDGQILRGIVVEKQTEHKQLKLHTGWCVHPEMKCKVCSESKDEILRHVPVQNVARMIRTQ